MINMIFPTSFVVGIVLISISGFRKAEKNSGSLMLAGLIICALSLCGWGLS